jgi:isocitrate dehydrogenase (NAD+)
MKHSVTVIRGDGTGPELTAATMRVLEATGVAFDWDVQDAGENVMLAHGEPLPDHVVASIKRTKTALKGPITTPVGKGFRSINVRLRKDLDCYANVRPAKIYPGVRTRYSEVDLVIVRENIEDLYAGIEFEKGAEAAAELIAWIKAKSGKDIRPDSGISIKPISVYGSERIVRYAFEYARARGRKKVSVVHKANIMKHTDGLFLEVARQTAADYPDLAFEDVIVDNMCMQLVQKPELYDVLVLPNLYGDIVSDLASGLVGGLGVTPGANIGADYAIFEAVHGSAPKYAGQDKVNPTAMILAGKMMLEHLGEADAARRLETAVAEVIKEGKSVTYDMKPSKDDPTAVGTRAMADAIIAKITPVL